MSGFFKQLRSINMKRKSTSKGFFLTLDNQSLAMKLITSIISIGDLFILLNKHGQTLSYTKLKQDEDGKMLSDAEACTKLISEGIPNDPMMNIGKNKVRCSAVESIENHNGKDFSGLIFRGEENAILAFQPIPTAEKRDLAVGKIHAAIESYESGKFIQPDLVGIL